MSNLLLFDQVGGGSSTRTPAPEFHRDGKVFRTSDGNIFEWRCGSEFPLLRWHMDGKDITPILDQRWSVGQRMNNVFLTSEIEDARLGDGGPYTDREILDKLGPFVDTCRTQGFGTVASVFQAVGVTMPQISRQHDFWNSVLDIAKMRPWMSVSMSQEWPKQLGKLDIAGLRRPAGQTVDGGGIMDGVEQGVYLGGGIWVSPMRGTHDAYQSARTADWFRKPKSDLDISQQSGMGCVCIEPMGADEHDEPGRRSNNPRYFFWNAATGRLMSLGVYFHAQAGIRGLLYGPTQMQCALSHYEALSLIPLDCQLGAYAKAVGAAVVSYDDEPGCSLRTYGMQIGGGIEQWVVVLDPGPNYPRNGGLIDPGIVPGWTVKQRLGVEGTILHVTRG